MLVSVAVKCYPILGQPELEFSGVMAHVGSGADEPFMSEIGTLLPIAPCGRNSFYNTTTEHPRDRGSRAFVSVASLVRAARSRP